MLVKKLRLNQYRNYESLELRPQTGINVIVGNNAQGKTNAAEAIFLCAFGRSHKTNRDSELIMHGCAGGYVGLDAQGAMGTRKIEIKLREGENKKIFLDTVLAQRTGELMGLLNVVMFSPEDLSLVKDGPMERRRFLDMEISQIKPAYYYRLQQYNAALRQRNALLKDGGEIKPGVLLAWDEQLAALGEFLIRERMAFVDGISTLARDVCRNITGGKESLNLCYRSCVEPEGNVKEALFCALGESALDDLRRGYTTVGPHRDDLAVSLGDMDVRTYGSQGQQRTAALSLKLAELHFLKGVRGEPPVLILDDVLSELDEDRQRLLFESMRDCQCFLTCTSLELPLRAGLKDVAVFTCKAGTIQEG